MILSALQNLMYPPPASVVITAMSAISFLSMSNAGLMEAKGKNMQYSKLFNAKEEKGRVQSKVGMIVAYGPAFLAGVSSFFLFPSPDFRFTLLRSALTTHFFKRIFEVLFIHKFSGSMEAEAMIAISASYFLSSSAVIYNQHLVHHLPEPPADLKYVGAAMFLLGTAGNLYHHYLLSKLRSKGEKQYKIPRGGLFSAVVCPHYLFEILAFWGMSCISQTLFSFAYAAGTTVYLVGRSYATRKWYAAKFDDFPAGVRALIPHVF